MIGVREGHRGLITVGPKFDRHRVSKNHPFRYPKFELFKSIDTSDTGIIIFVICRISHHLSRLDWNFRHLVIPTLSSGIFGPVQWTCYGGLSSSWARSQWRGWFVSHSACPPCRMPRLETAVARLKCCGNFKQIIEIHWVYNLDGHLWVGEGFTRENMVFAEPSQVNRWLKSARVMGWNHLSYDFWNLRVLLWYKPVIRTRFIPLGCNYCTLQNW